VLYILLFSRSTDTIGPLEIIGAVVWLTGFVLEIVADRQLQNFRNTKALAGTILKTGVWRYSRHPNYFGEALLWWGIYIIACSVNPIDAGFIPYGFITLFSPLVMHLLLRYVSGVPFLERKYMLRADF
jgi:steroid 5-alpha reductase family enzyme